MKNNEKLFVGRLVAKEDLDTYNIPNGFYDNRNNEGWSTFVAVIPEDTKESTYEYIRDRWFI